MIGKVIVYGATLAVVAVVATGVASAQQPANAARVGILFASTPAATAHLLEGLRRGLKERGYVEGQNIVLEPRYGRAGAVRMSDIAGESA